MTNNREPGRASKHLKVLIGAAFLTLVASCGNSAEEATTAENGSESETPVTEKGSVTVYSGRKEELVEPILERFEEETGIEVVLNAKGSAELGLLLNEEGDNSAADVFISQSPGVMGFLDEAGLLADIAPSSLDRVPESVRDDDSRWVGLSGRQRVAVYNTLSLTEQDLPQSIFELTEPQWKGKVGVAPENGSFQDFVTAMRVAQGDEVTQQWLTDLAANEPIVYSGNTAIVEAVGRENPEAEIGLVNHYYNYRVEADNENHKGLNHQFDENDPGSILIVTAAAKLKSSENSDSADTLIDWLLQEEAQRYFADETFEYPLASEVSPADGIPAASFSDVGGIDFSELGGGFEQTLEMIDEADFD